MNFKIKRNIFCIFLLGIVFDVCAGNNVRSLHSVQRQSTDTTPQPKKIKKGSHGGLLPIILAGVGVCCFVGLLTKSQPSDSAISASQLPAPTSASASASASTPLIAPGGPSAQNGTWISPLPNMYFNIAPYMQATASPRGVYDFLGRGVTSIGQSLLGSVLLIGSGLYWKRGYNPSAWSKDIGKFMRIVCGTSRACKKIKQRRNMVQQRKEMYQKLQDRAEQYVVHDHGTFKQRVMDQEEQRKAIPRYPIIQDIHATKDKIVRELETNIPNLEKFGKELSAACELAKTRQLKWT